MRTAALLIFAAGLMHAQAQAPTQAPPPAQAKGKQAPQPPLMECGVHGDIEILCGTRSPEDLELTPDGKYLIVPQFVNGRGGPGGMGLTLFDISKKTYAKMTVTAEPRKDWGDPACPGPIGDALTPHGISLSKRSGGAMQLFVVNHGGGRQSMEMFELKQVAGNWTAIWHGCVVAMQDYNDVAALPDGGYIATHPTALQGQGRGGAGPQISGFVSRWTPGKGEAELPGTRSAYPNGVLASSDGRYMYYNAWTGKEVHRYDLKESKETAMVKLDFQPDNISWTDKKQMLAAGIKGTGGECPAGSGTPCIQAFGVAEIDPAKMTAKTVFDSQGKGALIGGVSVALQVGNSMYIGAFQGDRLVKVGFKK
jgi:SMP-30/Gluconolactonase/LRE-like region